MFFTMPLAFVLLLVSPLWAAEVDHFSHYHASLTDSRPWLNPMINRRLARVLGGIQGCQERRLYQVLRKDFNNPFLGRLARDIVRKGPWDKTPVTRQQSIYKEFLVFSNLNPIFILVRNAVSGFARIGDIRIGTDKLGHFWGSGYTYFKRYYLQGKALGMALSFGWRNEHSILGARVSGVISYGDMLANFNGMRFWNHLLQRREDILGENLGPYIQCQQNQWVQVKQIDWGNYVDHGFDESINCSRFSSEKLLDKVQRTMVEISRKQGIELTCPMRTDVISGLQDKYGRLAPYLLNFHGHNSLGDAQWEGIYPSPKGLTEVYSDFK